MQLVYKFHIKYNDELYRLCVISKNLYNQALYTVKQELKNSGKWLSYYDLCRIMPTITNLEGEINYKLLKAQVAQLPMSDLESYINETPENFDLFEQGFDYSLREDDPVDGNTFNSTREWFIDDGKCIMSIADKDLGLYVQFEDDLYNFVDWCREKHYVGYRDKVVFNDDSHEYPTMKAPWEDDTRVGKQNFTYGELEGAFETLKMKVEKDKDASVTGYDIRNGYGLESDADPYDINHNWNIDFTLEDLVVELANIPELITYGNLEVYGSYDGSAYGEDHGIKIEDGFITKIY